jgi:AraC family transcriptional regulator of adaptative response / DNA-3-methyladenine glycosylase II
LIEAGVLDRGDVNQLAERVGVGARHLSRLFARHLEASPLQVALSLRVSRAKCLLDETRLPIRLIAERAGFSSTRRLSAALTKLYGKPLSAIRKQAPAHRKIKLAQPDRDVR